MEYIIREQTWKEKIRGHLAGPMGAIVFHIILIFVMIRYLTGDGGITSTRAPVELKLESKPIELEEIEEIQPVDLPDTMEDLDMTVPTDALTMDNSMPADTPATTPGETAVDLDNLQLISNVDSLVTISGLTRGGKAGEGGFGYNKTVRGDLVGTMYDLKRDGKGAARTPHYLEDLRSIIDGKLSTKAFSQFYHASQRLYSTHLYFPRQSADNGPAAFGAEKEVQPSNWIVHYSGMIKGPEEGRYRFVGMFDDLLMVFIDGKVVMEFLRTGDPTPWAPTDFVDKHMCFAGRPLVYGDWIPLNPLQTHRIDILIGEHPGGRVGGTLMVQQEGHTYPVAENGRPILPVFAVQNLTYPERKVLENAADWKFDFPPPIFNAYRTPKNDALITKPQADDILIEL